MQELAAKLTDNRVGGGGKFAFISVLGREPYRLFRV